MDSGHVDWASLVVPAASPWVNTGEGSTFVYAFVPVDYGSSGDTDAGISLLKPYGRHPDWFVHAERADMVLSGRVPPSVSVSANHRQVMAEDLTTEPLLAAILIGTSDAVYALPDRTTYWSCSPAGLTRRGRRMIKDLATLYLREPVLLTFLDLRPMKESAPGTVRGQATVSTAPGRH